MVVCWSTSLWKLTCTDITCTVALIKKRPKPFWMCLKSSLVFLIMSTYWRNEWWALFWLTTGRLGWWMGLKGLPLEVCLSGRTQISISHSETPLPSQIFNKQCFCGNSKISFHLTDMMCENEWHKQEPAVPHWRNLSFFFMTLLYLDTTKEKTVTTKTDTNNTRNLNRNWQK